MAEQRKIMRDLHVQVREKLQHLHQDGYFLKLADAMESWIDAWEQLNPPAASFQQPATAEAKAQAAMHTLPNGTAKK